MQWNFIKHSCSTANVNVLSLAALFVLNSSQINISTIGFAHCDARYRFFLEWRSESNYNYLLWKIQKNLTHEQIMFFFGVAAKIRLYLGQMSPIFKKVFFLTFDFQCHFNDIWHSVIKQLVWKLFFCRRFWIVHIASNCNMCVSWQLRSATFFNYFVSFIRARKCRPTNQTFGHRCRINMICLLSCAVSN